MHVLSELRSIQERVSSLDTQAAVKRANAEALVRDFAAKGVNVLTDATAFEQVDAAYRSADELAAEATKLRDGASSLIVASGGLGTPNDLRGLGRGTAPFGLTGDALRELHDAATRGQFHRVIPQAVTLGDFPPADRVGYDLNVLALLQERVRVADYIPREGLDTASKTYYRVTTGATAAAPVAPGADKPESSPVLEAVTARAKKVAHWGSVEDEVMADYGQWENVVGLEFIAGLIGAENAQVISGDGTGENQLGLIETPNVLTCERDTTNEYRLDVLARADTTLRNGGAFCEPTLRIMNPTDHLETLLERDGNDNYLAGDPKSSKTIDFWGVPTIVTTDMPLGTAIVANLALAAKVYWREAPVFEVHPNGGGLAEWKANTTLIRAESRFVLAVTRPAAICVVTEL